MKPNLLFRSTLCLALAGCLSTAEVSDPGADSQSDEPHLNAGPMPMLPFEGGSGSTAPWGGSNADNWRPEAVLANATSEALNTAWAMGAVKDVRVAVPVKLLDSGFTEFGDGQANA